MTYMDINDFLFQSTGAIISPVKKTSFSVEKRTEQRECESFLVRYSGAADPTDESTIFVKFAATFNVSNSGLSFRSPMPFEKTHRLSFMSDQLWEEERKGVVRWCSMIYPGIYKVGVDLL